MGKLYKVSVFLLIMSLIIGYIPVDAADTLSMPQEKVLYLEGSKGTKADGTPCKISYKKLVSNMISGFDADTMSVILESEDRKIVSATATGRIVAKSIGTAKVNVKVINADENLIFDQDLKVIVKKNATEVTVNGIAEGCHYTVGQVVLVSLPRDEDTDERELSVDKPEDVEVFGDDRPRTWMVSFLEPGEFTFTARAYQNEAYSGSTAEKTIKVIVDSAEGTEPTEVIEVPDIDEVDDPAFDMDDGEEDAEGENVKKEVFVSLNAYLNGDKLIVTPEFELEEGAVSPAGTMDYWYGFEGGESATQVLASGVPITEPFVWNVENEYIGEYITIKYAYSGDEHYETYPFDEYFDYDYFEIGLLPPVITSEPNVTRDGDAYSLSFDLIGNSFDELKVNEYYYLLTPYDPEGYDALSPKELVGKIKECYDNREANGETNNTYFGYGIIEGSEEIGDEKKVDIQIDGSLFEEGFYVLRIVITGTSCNIYDEKNYSKIVESHVFNTPLTPSLEVYTEVDSNNGTVLLSGIVSGIEGVDAPTGTLKYEYSIDGTAWNPIADNKSLGDTNAYIWSIPESIQNKTFWVRATYSGDDNYNTTVSESYELFFEAPLVESTAPKMTETGSFSTDTMTVEISANNVGDTIYYIVGNEEEKTFVCTENTATVSFDINKTTVVSAYVVEVGKIKSDTVTATYTYVEAPDSKPILTGDVSTDKNIYIVTADVSGITNTEGKTIEYSCDGTNYGSKNEFEVEAGKEITVYIRFAATSDLVASASVNASYKAPEVITEETTGETTEETTGETTEETTGETTEETTGETTEETTGETTEETTGETTEETTGKTTGGTTNETTSGTTNETTGETTNETMGGTMNETAGGTTNETTSGTTEDLSGSKNSEAKEEDNNSDDIVKVVDVINRVNESGDGTKTTTIITKYNDGKQVTEKKVEKPDGSSTSTTTTKEADGTTLTEKEEKKADGTTVTTNTIKETDGSSKTEKIEVKTDGTCTTTNTTKDSDGATTTEKVVEKPDGSITITATEKDADGNVLSTSKVIKKTKEDGTKTITATEKNADGNTRTSKTTLYTDGSSKISINTQNADGSTSVSKTTIKVDGSSKTNTETQNADGSTTTEKINKESDGSLTRTATTVDDDGNVLSKETEKVTISKSGTSTGTTFVENSDGSSSESVVKIKTDGSASTTLTETDAEGNVSVTLGSTNAKGTETKKSFAVEDYEAALKKLETVGTTATVPSTIKANGQTIPVTSIGDGAMKGNETVKTIKIADSVTSIGEGAFEGAKNLKTVKLSANITEIAPDAFNGINSKATFYITADSDEEFDALVELIKKSGVGSKVKFKRA